jgi:D-alanine-D-alanine ligase
MHKPTALKVFKNAGIPIAHGGVYKWKDIETRHPLHAPYVVKPIDEGSSVGVYIIQDTHTPLKDQIQWTFGEEVLVEEYVAGQELSCAVIENQALGVLELAPKEGFYDFTNKYTDGKTEHYMPARISKEVYEKIMEYTERAHKTLECSGVTRCDIRYDGATGKMAFLEINTLPGFTSLSIVPEIAEYRGISYDQLVYSLIEEGLCRALPR